MAAITRSSVLPGPSPMPVLGMRGNFAQFLSDPVTYMSMILQRYRLKLAPGARIDRQVKLTLAPKHGLPMIVGP